MIRGTSLIAATAVGFLFLASAHAQNKPEARARGLYTRDLDETQARGLYTSGDVAGINFKLLMKNKAGDFEPVETDRTFKDGDEIKVSFESNFEGFVYVVNVAPSGKKRVIFPTASTSAQDRMVRARQRYELPPSTSSFVFDRNDKGDEILQFVFSLDRIAHFDEAVRAENGMIGTSPSSAAAELSEPGLRVTAGTADKSNAASVMAETGGISSKPTALDDDSDRIRPRNVIIVPKSGKTRENLALIDAPMGIVAAPQKSNEALNPVEGKLRPGDRASFQIRLRHQ